MNRLTTSRLCNMREAELQADVLIPLFRAMGFRDVRHYHGGAGEQGKDIVMWWPDPLGDREYYAVVVKAGPISGQAKGSGSAGETFMQISQALGSTFVDGTDLATRRITKCFVVTPHAIKKEAVDSIRSALGARGSEDVVRLIGGDKLWELLEKFTPEQTVAAKLQFASVALENASPHHRVTAHVREGKVELGIEPKHPKADEMEPLQFTAQFHFPDTEAGKAIRQALDSHIRRGTGVSIPIVDPKNWTAA